MIAFLGDTKVKAFYLKRVRGHQRADEIVKGQYWQDGRGCGVGCTIHGSDHARYETELGIPRLIARLEDTLFEGLPNGSAKRWPAQFLAAIRVGADLSLVWPRFAVWLLVDKKSGVLRFAKTDTQRTAMQRVADLYARKIRGETIAESEWRAAATAAYAAAAAAATAAATAATADAAAAATAANAAATAAYAAAAATAATAAAWREARGRHYQTMARKLLTLLKAAPVVRKRKAA
jgi:hypothetical protein